MPGSIAELTTVRLGGHDQALMLRAESTANPVLLYLTGGPGGTDFGLNRVYWRTLERSFVVVSWDQRGVAKSYPSYEPASTLMSSTPCVTPSSSPPTCDTASASP